MPALPEPGCAEGLDLQLVRVERPGVLQVATQLLWLRRIELNLMTPVGMVWIHGSPLTKAVVERQIPEVADQYRAVVKSTFGFLDRQLAARPYIAGDTYSIADIVALCTLDFAARLNDLPHSTEQKHLTRWHESVSGRPSASA